MEWIGSWFSAPSNLQKGGDIPRELLVTFFEKGKEELFGSPAFRDHLRQGHEKGRSCQTLVDQAQSGLWESLGVQGAFGLAYLGKIRKVFSNDADMLRKFYEFVQLEERALDEAEMPEGDYRRKYEQVDAMAAQIKGREAELAGLSPEHRNAEIANMMRQMVNASLQVGQAPCCGSGDCKAPTLQQGAGGGGVCDLPPGAGAGGGVGAGEEVSRAAGGAGQWQAAGNNMSQEDQMRFFQALSQAPS